MIYESIIKTDMSNSYALRYRFSDSSVESVKVSSTCLQVGQICEHLYSRQRVKDMKLQQEKFAKSNGASCAKKRVQIHLTEYRLRYSKLERAR